MADLTFAGLTADIDVRLSPNERDVMRVIAVWKGDISLDRLARLLSSRLPKPHVFYAVGRLEDLHYLPEGLVR